MSLLVDLQIGAETAAPIVYFPVDPNRVIQNGDRYWRARLGIVAQSTRDEAELTVGEIINHFGGYYPNPRDPDEVIAAVGLEEKRRTRTRRLSGPIEASKPWAEFSARHPEPSACRS